MLNNLFSPWPDYSQEEVKAVQEVLLSNKVNYWTGDECRKFEHEFADYCDVNHAIALANGTVALDLALKALAIGPDDEVVVTSRTFIASVSSIVNAGATPIFADISAESQNITAENIEAVLTPQTKAIICVHLAGWPCDMDPIMALANNHNIAVIEDCAQAHGALYKGRSVGSIGQIGCWSFCQDKIMTTGGEGGMVTTNDKNLWSSMWSFKDHGKSWAAVYERQHPPGFRWLHDSFGTNWRMTEMQAAIGRIQLRRLPQWQKHRFSYAQQIWQTAKAIPQLRVPEMQCATCPIDCESAEQNNKLCQHAAYKCYVFVRSNEKDRDAIMAKINEAGVPCFSGSCSEVYLEKAFDGKGWRPKSPLNVARRLGETSLMFLCHPTLSQQAIDYSCQTLRDICKSHKWDEITDLS